MLKTGAGILLDGLTEQGVTTIFGYPGAAVLSIYDELCDSAIRHILVRHEQAAAHAADGYARASGRTGVCLATSGPGACNLVTGIATAYMDSVPMVALTGQVPTTSLGLDAFQEADITGITAPITRQNYLVKRTEDIAGVVREAFSVSRTGRCGPILVDLPRDVLANRIERDGRHPEPVGNAHEAAFGHRRNRWKSRRVTTAGMSCLGSRQSELRFRFRGDFHGKKVPDHIALRPGDQIDNPFVCTLKWYYS